MSPANPEHGAISNELAYYLTHHVKQHDLGMIYAAETGFIIERNPDTVRAPDVAFIRKDRIPARYEKGFCRIVPDLVVEVVSPDDSHSEVLDKVHQWLDAGVRLVWVVDPHTRAIQTYQSDRVLEALNPEDRIEGGEVIPGFSLSLSMVFPR